MNYCNWSSMHAIAEGAALFYWSLCGRCLKKARIDIGSESEWGRCEEKKLSSCRELLERGGSTEA